MTLAEKIQLLLDEILDSYNTLFVFEGEDWKLADPTTQALAAHLEHIMRRLEELLEIDDGP